MSKKSTTERKSKLRLGKETYGDMPIEECFRRALEPYFEPEKYDEPYLKRIG